MINITINAVNINNYLRGCTKIPIISHGRDWTPSFLGFTMSLSVNGNFSFVKGQEVLVSIDATEYYLGYINKFKFDYDNQAWIVEVNHYLMKFEVHYVSESDLHAELIKDIADFTTESEFTTTVFGQYLTSDLHGLSDGSKIQVRSTGTLPSGLEIDHSYYVRVRDVNTFYLYENYGQYINHTANTSEISSHITFGGPGTGTHYFTTIIDDKYNDWGRFNDIHFDINESTDQILTGDDNNFKYIPNDGNYHDQTKGVTIINIFSEVALPSPLNSSRGYIAAKFEEDTGFVLYNNMSDYSNNNRIDLSDNGNDFMYFSIIERYVSYAGSPPSTNNIPYPTSFISLKHFIEVIFSIIGINLITDDIDSVDFYSDYGWDELYVMEQMIYNINQAIIVRPETIENDYTRINSQITFIDMIYFLFCKLGINLKYEGSYTYRLIKHDNDSKFTIGDNYKLKYVADEVSGDSGGWTITKNAAGIFADINLVHGWSFFYNDKETYPFYDSSLSEFDADRSGRGYNTIDWYNNLIIFLKERSAGKRFVSINSTNWNSLNDALINNEVESFNETWQTEEIECRQSQLSQSKWNVKEISLSVQNKRINITQESILV